MGRPEQLGQAGLAGWREKVADRVAPAVGRRAPVSEEQARAAIGAAFFVLSVVYVATSAKRMLDAARS